MFQRVERSCLKDAKATVGTHRKPGSGGGVPTYVVHKSKAGRCGHVLCMFLISGSRFGREDQGNKMMCPQLHHPALNAQVSILTHAR